MKKTKIIAVAAVFILLAVSIVLLSSKPEDGGFTLKLPFIGHEEEEKGWKEINEYFTLYADDLWMREDQKLSEGFAYCCARYADPDSKQKEKVWVDFQADTSKAFASPTEYLNSMFGSEGTDNGVVRGEVTFGEFNAKTAEIVDAAGYRTVFIVFSRGWTIYSIGYCTPIGDEEALADVQKLIDGFEVEG